MSKKRKIKKKNLKFYFFLTFINFYTSIKITNLKNYKKKLNLKIYIKFNIELFK